LTIPMIGPDVRGLEKAAFVHPTACLYGAVELCDDVSVWCNVVVRAESSHVRIGARTNLQDFAMVHVGSGPTLVGADCSITHHVTIHGCQIGEACLIGINAVIMDDAVIGAGSIVAGGAFVKEGTVIPPNSIVMGAPAEVRRSRDSSLANRMNAFMYVENGKAYARGDFRVWSSETFRTASARERERLMAGIVE
jgi:carbonic anhydrase/acetyltransferase-like protein (isoleucine patch superfamily)